MRFLLLFLILISFAAKAQESEELKSFKTDSTVISKVKDTLHSPRKAALYSLIPGGGQIYNHFAMPKGKKKAFWKVPLLYAGLGYTGFKLVQNHITQRDLKAEYLYRIDNNQANLADYAQYDDQGVLTLFEDFRRKRDLMIFAFIAVYGLGILDAHVEAHFVNFDISKDLSFSIKPRMQDFRTPGLSLSLNFR